MSQFVLSRPHISYGSTEYAVGNRNVNTILYVLKTCRSAGTLRVRHPMNRAVPCRVIFQIQLVWYAFDAPSDHCCSRPAPSSPGAVRMRPAASDVAVREACEPIASPPDSRRRNRGQTPGLARSPCHYVLGPDAVRLVRGRLRRHLAMEGRVYSEGCGFCEKAAITSGVTSLAGFAGMRFPQKRGSRTAIPAFR